jgi:hypothetical protein
MIYDLLIQGDIVLQDLLIKTLNLFLLSEEIIGRL